MENNREDIELIEHLLARDLSPYARQFVLSLRSWARAKEITEQQATALRKIELTYGGGSMKTSDNIEHPPAAQWSAAKFEKAKVCAQYYIDNPPYFNDLSFRILNHKDYIPSGDQYDRLVNNKYAQRVLKEHDSPCKFNKGTLVSLRKPAISKLSLFELESTPLLVVKERAAPIVSSAAGGKRYMVVPVGQGAPLIIEERYLKKYNKNY
jgi:hypothetical protein